MRIAAINSVYYGSTGKIMLSIAGRGKDKHEFLMCCPKGRHNQKALDSECYVFGNRWAEDFHIIMGRIFGLQGFFSYGSTKQLLRKLDEFKPDILHFHNLHNSFINLPLLFNYVKKNNIRVVWTLHDCWSFTGHCAYFTYAGCEKWKEGCKNCPSLKMYPKSIVDHSKWMYSWKKKLFCGMKDVTIVTPSQWLKELAQESFLRDYQIVKIHNGIDLKVFRPVMSDFRGKYNCEKKKIILGVAFGWEERKGMDVFIELSKRLDDTYQIVLVGTDERIDQSLPDDIISIHRTKNQQELVKIYTAADVLVNPTREDNFPTVNLEALACGTPVITFDTGGCAETIDESCGVLIKDNSVDTLEKEIIKATTEKVFSTEACVKWARHFDHNSRFDDYIKLYEGRYE